MSYQSVSIVPEKQTRFVYDREGKARKIKAEIMLTHGLTEEELTGSGRMDYLVLARREMAVRIYREAGLGTVAIGKLLNRDSATVRACIKRAMKKKNGTHKYHQRPTG